MIFAMRRRDATSTGWLGRRLGAGAALALVVTMTGLVGTPPAQAAPGHAAGGGGQVVAGRNGQVAPGRNGHAAASPHGRVAPGGHRRPVVLSCGAVITQDTKLANNIGPCQGDGLIVDGSNIRIDLMGHTITGSHQGCPGTACAPAAEQVGIDLNNVSGDTLQHGTVQYFDGGVFVDRGAGNTVRGIYAHDNVNRDVLINLAVPGPGVSGPTQTSCDYGDGILVQSSGSNRIVANTVAKNGPYDGIATVGVRGPSGFVPADNNVIVGNRAMDNYVADQTPSGGGTLCGSASGEIYGGMGEGRQVQDMGIRIEGPDSSYNTIRGNQVSDNGLDGIAVFDYFCNINGAMHEPANHDNTIVGNQVSGTGDKAVQAASGQVDPSANGIAVLAEGNPGVDCSAYNTTIADNVSSGNIQDGIFVGGAPSAPGHPEHTTVVGNLVGNNTLDGLGVQSGAMDNQLTANVGQGNAEFDGADYNFSPNCGTDTWTANQFGSVNQPCVAANGGSGTVQEVLFTGAAGIATGLQTSWSGLVSVTNPAGFTVYSGTDSTCTTPLGTGQAPVTGNGTNSVTVSMTNLPPPGNAYFEVAADSVSAGNGVTNAAVGCTPIEFTGTPTVDTVTGVTITGTIADPTFTVTGTGFGSTPPAPDPSTPPDGQQGCPASPTNNPSLEGYLYGTNLYVSDQGNSGFDAGVNSVTGEFDCVGLVIKSWSPTQVVFGFGDLYDQPIPGNDYVLSNGDPVQVVVLGAVGQTTVSGLA